jgi:hypothetical protein
MRGRHGVGKTAMFKEAATREHIGLCVCDLSLLEPVDLVGIPYIDEAKRTVYATPSFLPIQGEGLLVFEELNRCPRHVRVPCLQLLTARCLNEYVLAPGWLPCAAINEGDEYFVDALDPAHLSRFLQVRIEPDVTEWIEWARGKDAHPKILEFVETTPGVFDDPVSNPRAWTYASNLLRALEQSSSSQDLIAVGLSGVLDDHLTAAFLEFYAMRSARPLMPAQIIDGYRRYRSSMLRWLASGHLDVVEASWESLKRHLQRQKDYDAVVGEQSTKANVELFFADLPPDLKPLVRRWLKNRGFEQLKVSRKTRG